MASLPGSSSPFFYLALLLLSGAFASIAFLPRSAVCADEDEGQMHIVYMGHRLQDVLSMESFHLNFLEPVLGLSKAKNSLAYSYRSFNGLAVRLNIQEKRQLESMDGVVSVFPSRILKPHTTGSWDFLGFPPSVKRDPKLESDVIIGVIDSGIRPESESFRDDGLGPPPRRWKGRCLNNFPCNNKIIGARYYNSGGNSSDGSEEQSARDTKGHGSHTASTVAGRDVRNASLYGLARGTARGAVPSARIAAYKVCWKYGCADEDVLKAFDDAISDGVDVLSVSLGQDTVGDYFSSSAAIGAFHAMKHGILTTMSAGNDGPDRFSVINVAPWLLSVAAATTRRKMVSALVVGGGGAGGNRTEAGSVLQGASVNTFPTEARSYPFIHADAAAKDGRAGSGVCNTETLDPSKAKGKILLCDEYNIGSGPLLAGARGMVIADDYSVLTPEPFPLPAMVITTKQATDLKRMLSSTNNTNTRSTAAVAKLHKSRSSVDQHAPEVAFFSSRGPSPVTPDILKPDLSAPGVNILAAYVPGVSISDYNDDRRSVDYTMLSGTSMACPHVTGAAAYVKSFHPDWSPSALMSALITTTTPMGPHPDAELAYGSGLVNPTRAVRPGLVYEATIQDYVRLLCNQGYTSAHLRLLTGDATTCPPHTSKGTARDFNYPTMSFYQNASAPFAVHFPRTVTNVGPPKSTYRATVAPSSQGLLRVTVTPAVLAFSSKREKKAFVVSVSGEGLPMGSVASASLTWSDGVHHVRSPIVVSVIESDGLLQSDVAASD